MRLEALCLCDIVEVGQRKKFMRLDASVRQGCAELGPEREVFAWDVGKRDMEGIVGGGVAAKVGEQDGGAERIEIWKCAARR